MPLTVNTFLNSFSNKLEEPVRQHLQNVYACLAMSTIAAAVGSSIHLFTNIFRAGLLAWIGAFVFLALLMFTPDEDGKNTNLRMAYLLGWAGLTGVGVGPVLETVIELDASLIIMALMGTALVFISFSICSMLAERGKWLYLGGTLLTFLNTTLFLSVANVLFDSNMIYQANLYLGLVLMCGFVLYDTQLIIEKRRQGSTDFVAHSMDLFADFIGIFKKLLVILTQKITNERRRISEEIGRPDD